MLTVDPRDHPRRQPHLSAASGLVAVGSKLYAVADDELHLAHFEVHDLAASPVQLVPLAGGALPDDPAARKQAKADLEVMLHLTRAMTGREGELVLLGSGSRPQRERGFLLPLQGDGAPGGPAREFSLSPLYDPLRARFGELNLEGGYPAQGRIHLFQRAHRGQPLNGRIRYDAAAFAAWLRTPNAPPPAPLAIDMLAVGEVEGIPLGITDAAPWPAGGCVFTAVAEDTSDAYLDGRCVASAVGWLDAAGRIVRCERLAGAPKVEGIALVQGRLLLVTDADDPARASELLELEA